MFMALMEEEDSWSSFGEDVPADLRRPFSRLANRQLRNLTPGEPDTVIDLGDELGKVPIRNVRFRDYEDEGKLLAYVRHEADEPVQASGSRVLTERKVIVPTVIALGIAAAGLYKLIHDRK
jgi:hypothetical protein